jgi:galactokinase
VNLIGEHTDYNDGFVLPMAIDRAVWIALRPCRGPLVRVHSLDFSQTAEFRLSALTRGDVGWLEYVKGVAWAIQEAGHPVPGWEGVIAGDVPIGAGLSSSAALEMATARAFVAVSDVQSHSRLSLPWDPVAMARLAQRAENEWVGVQCGIMDQMISAAAQAGRALLIDCRSLEIEAVPLPANTSVVVLDTATRRGLAASAYNERRAQCEAAARFFGVPALRDVDLSRFQVESAALNGVIRRRARHVVTENRRTLKAAEAMRRGDAVELGRLMDASHESLRNDFEVSGPELDAMVACARRQAGCYGARMTGAGFGGCAVALVDKEAAPAFAVEVGAAYHAETGLTPSIYECHAAAGAQAWPPGDATYVP